MNISFRFFPSVALSIILVSHSFGETFIKDANTLPLNDPASWVDNPTLGDAVPGPSDIALWDGTVTGPNSSLLGGSLSWLGIHISTVGGARNVGNRVTIADPGSANTLTIGAGGIDMSDGTQALLIQSGMALSAGQTWNVPNVNTGTNPAGLNKGEDLTFFALAANTPFDLGGFTVSKIGAGVAAIATGYTVSNGVINIDEGLFQIQSGGSRVTTISSNVTLNVAAGATLRISAESGAGGLAVQNDAPINLAAGSTLTLQENQNNAINLTGNISAASGDVALNLTGGGTFSPTSSGNLTGAANINFVNTATNAILSMSGDNSGYTGTLTLAGGSGKRTLRLSSPTAGSSAATWVVNAGNVLEVDSVPVSLGTLNGAGSVTNPGTGAAAITVGGGTFSGVIDNGGGTMALSKVGPGTLVLSGANTYSGDTLVQGGTLRTTAAQTGGGAVSVADGATFGIRFDTPTTFNSSALTLGSAAGGTKLALDLGPLGNPSNPVIAAPSFTVNGSNNTIALSGSGLTTGTFKLIDYTGAIGGTGFNGLSFSTDIPRIIASLVNNTAGTSVDLNISGIDKPKWTGAVNANWDIDNGTGTGTPNWREVISGNVTRYLQVPSGSDSVIFDDSATGPTAVNLTTTLTPSGVLVNNSVKTYSFTGPGKLSGATGIVKQGSGAFYLANTGGNDYTGATLIEAGSLFVGNGVAGEGQLGSGTVVNNAELVLNRPDDFIVANAITGSGVIRKVGGGTATLSGTITLAGATTIQEGAIQLSGLADLPGGVVNNSTLVLEGSTPMTGVISGAGPVLALGAGPKQIAGSSPNVNTGGTTVSAGVLQLNKTPGVNAVGGDILIDGTGRLQLLAADQIPDSATVTYASAGPSTTLGNETIANINIIGGSEQSQFVGNNGLVVSNLLTVATGVFAVASNHTVSVGGLNISGGIVRIAANANPSTLNVGAGGITATGGLIQVGQGGANFDAILNLEGDYTGSGFVDFTRGGYFGANKREINLGTATRTFNVISDTTTISPDVTGSGGLIKAGDGALFLSGSNTYTGDTVIQAGTLSVTGTIAETPNIVVKGGATFDVIGVATGYTLAANQTLRGTGTVSGNVTVNGTVAPGEGIGTLNFAGDLTLAGTAQFELNKGFTLSSDLAVVTNALMYGGTLAVTATGAALGAGDTFNLFDAASFGGAFSTYQLPTLGAGLTWDTSRLLADGSLVVVPEPGSLVLLLTASAVAVFRRRRR